jgi:hypothetical protein
VAGSRGAGAGSAADGDETAVAASCAATPAERNKARTARRGRVTVD